VDLAPYIVGAAEENLEHIAHALDDYINGKHELFAKANQYLNNESIRCSHRVHWSWESNESGDLVLKSGRKETQDVVSEEKIYDFFTTGDKCMGVKEDLTTMKILWFTLADSTVHPIVIDDDNFEQELESRVAVRARKDRKDKFRQLSHEESMLMQNVCLIHGDLIQAILDPWYLVNAVTLCEENLNRIRHHQQFVHLCSGT